MTENAKNQCTTLWILAIIFAVLAWIPFIWRFFLAASITMWIIAIVQKKKKAICGIIGTVMSGLVIAVKITIIIGIFSLWTKGISMVLDEIPNAVAQESLPQLVQYIEEYKSSFGDYPDTLLDLDKLSKEALDNSLDPFQFKTIIAKSIIWGNDMTEEEIKKVIPLYYYKKKANGYYLFSNGSDGKPFTDDDILPDLDYITGANNLQLP